MKKPLLLIAGLNLVVLLVVALGYFLSGGFESAERIRARYAARSPEVLKIAEPVQVTDSFAWLDGGTVGIELTDAEGRKHLFSLCHTYADGAGASIPPPNLYVGASHVSKPGAKMVAVRGPEEADLYGLLLRWIERQPSRQAFLDPKVPLGQQPRADLYLHGARTFFQRLEKHFVR